MGFLDDLKGVLHVGEEVAPTVANAINPAAGTLVGLVVTAVTRAEQAGGSGPQKKAAVAADVLPAAAALVGAALKSGGLAPQVDPDQLASAVGSITDGVVALLNGVTANQPAATTPASTSSPTSGGVS